MNSLFDTPADKLPLEIQYLRKVLWNGWEATSLPRSNWLEQLRVFGAKQPSVAFETMREAGVFVGDGDKFHLDKEA